MRKNLMFVMLLAKFSVSFAHQTGISGVDDQVTFGTTLLKVFLYVVGLGCIAYAAYMFGSGKAKQQGLELIFGLLVMAGIAVGGTAWWVGKSSGFLF